MVQMVWPENTLVTKRHRHRSVVTPVQWLRYSQVVWILEYVPGLGRPDLRLGRSLSRCRAVELLIRP